MRAACQVAANIALVKNLTLHGVFWGSYMQHSPAVLQGSLQELLSWLAAGKISVPVSHRRAAHTPWSLLQMRVHRACFPSSWPALHMCLEMFTCCPCISYLCL